MIHVPPGVAPADVTIRVQCPTCSGHPYRLIRGATWGYAGGSPAEYAECPSCEGRGTVLESEADDCPPDVRDSY